MGRGDPEKMEGSWGWVGGPSLEVEGRTPPPVLRTPGQGPASTGEAHVGRWGCCVWVGDPWAALAFSPVGPLTLGSDLWCPRLGGDTQACERPQAMSLSSQEAPPPAATCGMQVGTPQAHSRQWGAGETRAGSRWVTGVRRVCLRCPTPPSPCPKQSRATGDMGKGRRGSLWGWSSVPSPTAPSGHLAPAGRGSGGAGAGVSPSPWRPGDESGALPLPR